jgi:hypothetical protein
VLATFRYDLEKNLQNLNQLVRAKGGAMAKNMKNPQRGQLMYTQTRMMEETTTQGKTKKVLGLTMK